MKRTMLVMTMVIALAMSTMSMAVATGASIGNDDNQRTSRDSSWKNWTIVDTNNPADGIGTVEEIRYYSLADNPMRFFIVNDELEVTWVSAEFSPGVGARSYVVPESNPAGVGLGDMIGMYFGAFGGSIAWATTGGASIYEGDGSGPVAVEDVLDSHTLSVTRYYSVVADIVPADAPTKDSCKDGGWEEYTTTPGPFKNQGQCVSHFAKAK